MHAFIFWLFYSLGLSPGTSVTIIWTPGSLKVDFLFRVICSVHLIYQSKQISLFRYFDYFRPYLEKFIPFFSKNKHSRKLLRCTIYSQHLVSQSFLFRFFFIRLLSIISHSLLAFYFSFFLFLFLLRDCTMSFLLFCTLELELKN